MSILPQPGRDRWQPLRLGLVNLFHYDEEVFPFRDGHLLLRGNNGTGKSKVLALALPFLLDGRLTPARVEPDGDPGKRMEWNLLLGGKYSERQGYTWIEFGREDGDGTARTLTAGCGLRAVAGRPVQSWFFVTEQRIGEELVLIDSHDRTLGRDRLKEALAGRGEVYDQAARYRRALDEALFHLGDQRYEALIQLLIQLRQPQLSKRPDERALSHALTEALPPLDQGVLAEVAEAFRNLDAEREELDALLDTRTAVEQFLHHYRAYARVAGRRRAREVRQAQSRYEKLGADLGQRQEALGEALTAERELARAADAQEQTLADARTEADTLRASEAMRSARELELVEADAAKEARRADDAEAEERRLEGELERQGARLARHRERSQASAGRLAGALADAEAVAREAALAEAHGRILAPLALPDGPESGTDESLAAGADQQVRALVARRREAIGHLQGLNRRVREAEQAHGEARRAWQGEVDAGHRLEVERAEAEQAAEAAGDALVAAVRRHGEALQVLTLEDLDAVAAALADWVASLDGANPARGAVEEAHRLAVRRIEAERAELRVRRGELEGERDAWRAEQRRLEAGEHAQPPLPYHRTPGSRSGRAGAPLWQLVDFREGVPPETAASLEAALEASGLLDAWVLPGGRLLAADTWDTVLVPETPAPAGLSAVLAPAVDRADPAASQVSDEVLAALLASVGWGPSDHPAWVAEDGRWRLGPGNGAWGKPQAEYIGRGAREAARRRRLAELADLIAVHEARIEELDQRLADLDDRQGAADRERDTLPDDAPLRSAHDRVADLTARRRDQQTRIEAAERALAEAREALQQRVRERDDAAGDLGLPTDPEALGRLQEGVLQYAGAAPALWSAVREHWQARALLAEAVEEVEGAQARLQAQRERRTEARQAARAAAVHRDTLRATVGAAVEEVLRRLAAAEGRMKAAERALKENQQAQKQIAGRIEGLRRDIEHLTQERRAQGEARDDRVRALETYAAEGLLGAALPDLETPGALPWAADPAVRLARRMEEHLADVDDADVAWERHQRGLMEHITGLQGALARRGHQAAAEPVGDLLVVRVVFQARAQSPHELAASLDGEVAERRDLLNAREQELLENYLIDEVAHHLQAMVSDAERRVADMNAELEQRPTSTGMRLRIQWRPLEEGTEAGGVVTPGGLPEIRRRLRQLAAAWTPEDRQAVGRFLKQRIDEARNDSAGGALVEVLERALDYRHWHRFVVERFQDGRWRPAYGPASGGERALVVTIPLFAAASSHYASASPQAPRLVMLDEAFAGIDDDSRAKCMALLAQFDLDFMMTSEREWGCYPDLPGLAIAQLVRREGWDAVFVSHWSWDGRRRRQEASPLPPPAAEESAPDTDDATEDLFR